MPSGKVAKPDITDNKDGTVTVKYSPTEAGLHEMDIKYDGIHIPGTSELRKHEPIQVRQKVSDVSVVPVNRKSSSVLRGLLEQR